MKRNKQEKERKEIARLKREWDDISNLISKQSWIELDKPIHRGWDAELRVRDDFSRSKYNEGLQLLVDWFGTSVWSSREDFKYRCGGCRGGWAIRQPWFSDIDERTYDSIPPMVQKYYSKSISFDNNPWSRKQYYCNVDHWKFEKVITKSYSTHYQEHDEILYQMEAEVKDELYSDKYRGKVWPDYKGKGFWNRKQRKGENGKVKRTLIEVKKGYNNKDNDVDYWNLDYDGYKLDLFPTGKATDWWYWW